MDFLRLVFGRVRVNGMRSFNGEVAPQNMTGIGCQAERRAGTPKKVGGLSPMPRTYTPEN